MRGARVRAGRAGPPDPDSAGWPPCGRASWSGSLDNVSERAGPAGRRGAHCRRPATGSQSGRGSLGGRRAGRPGSGWRRWASSPAPHPPAGPGIELEITDPQRQVDRRGPAGHPAGAPRRRCRGHADQRAPVRVVASTSFVDERRRRPRRRARLLQPPYTYRRDRRPADALRLPSDPRRGARGAARAVRPTGQGDARPATSLVDALRPVPTLSTLTRLRPAPVTRHGHDAGAHRPRSSGHDDRPGVPRRPAIHERSTSGSGTAGDAVRVGITAYAQDALGDIVYVSLPDEGARSQAGAAVRRGRVDQERQRDLRAGHRHGRRAQRGAGGHAGAGQHRPVRRGVDVRGPARTTRLGSTGSSSAAEYQAGLADPRLQLAAGGRGQASRLAVSRPGRRGPSMPTRTGGWALRTSQGRRPPARASRRRRPRCRADARGLGRNRGRRPEVAATEAPPAPTSDLSADTTVSLGALEHARGGRSSPSQAQRRRRGRRRGAAGRVRPAGRAARPQRRGAVPAGRRRDHRRAPPGQRHLPRRRDGVAQARGVPPPARRLRRPRRRQPQRHLRPAGSDRGGRAAATATRSRSASTGWCSTRARGLPGPTGG